MKHIFVFLVLAMSLFVVYLVFTGQVTRGRGLLPRARTTAAPAVSAAPHAPATNPAGTVRRVIRSGNNLGQSTRKAFENVNFNGQP